MTGLRSSMATCGATEAIKGLIPDPAPKLSDEDLCYLTGLSERDLADLDFPEPNARIVTHTAIDRNPYAWSKSTAGECRYVLTRRSMSSYETLLLEIPQDRHVDARTALGSENAAVWFRFVKSLRPGSICAMFPNAEQGREALAKTFAGTHAEYAVFEALAMHCQILVSSAHAVTGLANKLIECQPVLGPLKLKSLLAELEPACHAKKAVAVDARPSQKIAGPLSDASDTHGAGGIGAEDDSLRHGFDDED